MKFFVEWESGGVLEIERTRGDVADIVPNFLSMCSESRVIGPNSADTLEDWTLDDLAPLDGESDGD